jgi:CDP-paratose 2-epimerase
LAKALRAFTPELEIVGLDNLSRRGSEQNRRPLEALGARIFHGDVRSQSDLQMIPRVDWVIDAAANPSVLAGVDTKTSSRQVIENNLLGSLNLLEFCKVKGAGFILLSSSRVYSVAALSSLPMRVEDRAYQLSLDSNPPPGVTPAGISESFSTSPPLSLYGISKLASEYLALEYGAAFGFPVGINRCGILAGGGQFGQADQGIFAFWINAYIRGRPLRYIGFDGQGHQVRDCLHPSDLAILIWKQMHSAEQQTRRVINVGGGNSSAISLAQLSDWCAGRYGKRQIASDLRPRQFDLPWIILNSDQAKDKWSWAPTIARDEVLIEIAIHAEKHPDWLEISGAL